MKCLLPIACCLCLIAIHPGATQTEAPSPVVNLPLELSKEPGQPLLIQSPGKSTIALFYPASMPYADNYHCQAIELDTIPHLVRRTGPVGKMRIEWGWKGAPVPLGGYQNEQAAYAWLLDQNSLIAIRIDRRDLSVLAAVRLKVKNPDDVMCLIERGHYGLLLLREKRRGNKGVLKIVRLEADSIVGTQEIPAGHLPGLFSKNFKPRAAQTVAGDPALAAFPYRLFDAGDTIRITHDGRFGPDGLETAYMRLYTLDLARGKIALEELPYLPKGVQTGIAAHGASYIAGGKLFQLYVTHANWNLLVRDLATRVLLHNESIGLADSLPALNTPLQIPKNFLQANYDSTTREFLVAHMETMPYLIVVPAPEGYRLELGGSKVARNDAWALALFLPKVAVAPVLFNIWSRQNSFSYAKILNRTDLKSLAAPRLERSFFEACDALADKLDKSGTRSASKVFQLGDRFLLGVYTGQTGLYSFFEVK